jgi:hypothetical protein
VHERRSRIVLRAFGGKVDPAVHGAGVIVAFSEEKVSTIHENGRAAGEIL